MGDRVRVAFPHDFGKEHGTIVTLCSRSRCAEKPKSLANSISYGAPDEIENWDGNVDSRQLRSETPTCKSLIL